MITAIIVGLIAGWAGGMLFSKKSHKWWMNLIIGLIGGSVGNFVFGLLGLGMDNIIWDIISATVGAVIVLWLYSVITGKKK